MFSESLRELIAASLVDGMLTPEERAIIVKRALLEGNDPDEVNLLLDAEVQKIRQQKQAAQPKLLKCPACGEILPALTGICPSCGSVVSNDSRNQELDFLIEQMNRGLAQLKAGTVNAPLVVATLEEHRRKAMTLYGENPKVKVLLEEIRQEVAEWKKQEAERRRQEAEMKKMEEKARIAALKGSGGGNSLSYQNNKGCYTGCLVALIIGAILTFIGMCSDSQTELKVDEQYNTLVGQLDSLKALPLTIENFEQRKNAAMDIIWTTVDEYSSYEKTKKETFDKLFKNYTNQLSTFYVTHKKEIDKYCGHEIYDLSEVEEDDTSVSE
ncbi:MAG: zinc ribbon domain-containing protein [Prevotella sp.]|nr:zinc ribbon domain-containing protein [Prevotella sp.]